METVKFRAKWTFSKVRVLLFFGGFILLLLVISQVDAAPGSNATDTIVISSVQTAMVSGLLATGSGSGHASCVDIPRRCCPCSPYVPPHWTTPWWWKQPWWANPRRSGWGPWR